MSNKYIAEEQDPKDFPDKYKNIAARETERVRGGLYHGLVYINDIPRKYTVGYYDKPVDPECSRAVIRIQDYAGWTEREEAPYIRRVIYNASPPCYHNLSGERLTSEEVDALLENTPK